MWTEFTNKYLFFGVSARLCTHTRQVKDQAVSSTKKNLLLFLVSADIQQEPCGQMSCRRRCCSITRTHRWCSEVKLGRGIRTCRHILTTNSTSPLCSKVWEGEGACENTDNKVEWERLQTWKTKNSFLILSHLGCSAWINLCHWWD